MSNVDLVIGVIIIFCNWSSYVKLYRIEKMLRQTQAMIEQLGHIVDSSKRNQIDSAQCDDDEYDHADWWKRGGVPPWQRKDKGNP